MKKLKGIITACILLLTACGKSGKNETISTPGGIDTKIETANGITYRIFMQRTTGTAYKGILVMGSGNDENNPTPGSLDGAAETDLCTKAAQNGYIAAVVQYRKTAGTADWNTSVQQIGEDYDKCIKALASKYGVDKSQSVVGGESYSSFMLLSDVAANNTLSYCRGVLAPCGATGQWQAEHFKIPVFNIVCSGNNEGDLSGKPLYDAITNAAIKSKSGGVTDTGCSTHCGGQWTDQLYTQLNTWLK